MKGTNRLKRAARLPVRLLAPLAAVCADAVDAVPSAAPAEPLHADRAAAAGAAPSTVSTPRRDRLPDRCTDRFDMYGTPTARLPEISTFAVRRAPRTWGDPVKARAAV
jgi:hypothetical protein